MKRGSKPQGNHGEEKWERKGFQRTMLGDHLVATNRPMTF